MESEGSSMQGVVEGKDNLDWKKREESKKQGLAVTYAGLNEDQKKKFVEAQEKVVGLFGGLVNSDTEIPNLSLEEQALVNKTRSFVKEQKEANPGKAVAVAGFSQEEDKLVYENLINRWAMAETLKPQVDSFGEFQRGNGETNGDFWWFQSVNQEAEKMKTEGKFKWGDHRIYFDVPHTDMVQLARLTEEVAANEKIPIGFKYLDLDKTAKANIDGTETRFVANFANVDDARRFYEALSRRQEYQDIQPDRSLDYLGYKIDDKATYANGFREKRAPLKNIVENAKKNPDGTYGYLGVDSGKKITISAEQYVQFVDQFKKLPDPMSVWRGEKVN